MSTRLTETRYLEFASDGRIDEENGILFGVKLIGEHSKNGRRYKPEAMKAAVGLYEGRKMYVNHPGKNEGAERKFEDWGGVFKNVRHIEGQGNFGDLHLRRNSGFFEGILEAAKTFPNAVGFSHVADGDSKMEGDTEIVESIREVFSVDLVTDPATTAGFFEGVKTMNKKTIKQIIEAAPEDTKHRKRLVESIEAGTLDESIEVEVPPDADARTEIAMAILEAPESAFVTPVETNHESDDKLAAAEKKLQEQGVKLARIEAKTLLLESNIEATDVRIKALATTPEADRAALLESWPTNEGGERPARSPGITESEGSTDFDFKEEGSFAARYR
jgi:hypothetical protein